MFGSGFFGNLFDFNGDGKLDSFEEAMDLAAMIELAEHAQKKEDDDGDDKD